MYPWNVKLLKQLLRKSNNNLVAKIYNIFGDFAILNVKKLDDLDFEIEIRQVEKDFLKIDEKAELKNLENMQLMTWFSDIIQVVDFLNDFTNKRELHYNGVEYNFWHWQTN